MVFLLSAAVAALELRGVVGVDLGVAEVDLGVAIVGLGVVVDVCLGVVVVDLGVLVVGLGVVLDFVTRFSSTLFNDVLLGVTEDPEELRRTTPPSFNAGSLDVDVDLGVVVASPPLTDEVLGVLGVELDLDVVPVSPPLTDDVLGVLGVELDLGVVVEAGLSARLPLDDLVGVPGVAVDFAGGVELDLGVLGVEDATDLGVVEDLLPVVKRFVDVFSLEKEFSLVVIRLWPLRTSGWLGLSQEARLTVDGVVEDEDDGVFMGVDRRVEGEDGYLLVAPAEGVAEEVGVFLALLLNMECDTIGVEDALGLIWEKLGRAETTASMPPPLSPPPPSPPPASTPTGSAASPSGGDSPRGVVTVVM